MTDHVQPEEGFDMFQEPEGFRPPPPEPTQHVIPRKIPGADPLKVTLVGHHSLWAHCLWNAGLAVAEYFDANPELVRGRRVLELGAGAGLPSCVAALQGATCVVPTDYPEDGLLAALAANLAANLPAGHVAPPFMPDRTVNFGGAPVRPGGYLWGAPAEPLLRANDGKPFDVVVLADLIFNHSEHRRMLETVQACLSKDSAAVAIVAFTHHRPHLAAADLAFLDVARDEFGLDVAHWWDERRPVMFEEDPGDADVRGTVHCYRLSRR